MKNFTDLFNEGKELLIKLEPKDYQTFLNFAEKNNLSWINGSKDYSLSNFKDHTAYAFICISKNKIIGFISAMCYLKSKEHFKGINLKEIC